MTALTTTRTAPARHGFYALRVAGVERLTDDAVAITFAVPDDLRAAFRYVAGQHLTVRRPGSDERRSYSICSSAVGQRLRIGVRRLAGGTFSGWAVDQLEAGAVMEVAPPAGRFTLQPGNVPRRVVALAAGSGITPVLSIVSTLLEAEPASEGTLVYANRTAASVMFLDEVANLKDRWPSRFTVLHVLSREETGSDLLGGRLTPARLRRMLDTMLPAADAWYLCGPQAMVAEAQATLLEAGIDPAAIHAELFHAGAAPPRPSSAASTGCRVTVRLDGRGTQVDAQAGESLLEAALRVRADAPYACRGGICGTCRARVTGAVEVLRDFALEPDERAAGLRLACQSYPTGAEAIVDFDV